MRAIFVEFCDFTFFQHVPRGEGRPFPKVLCCEWEVFGALKLFSSPLKSRKSITKCDQRARSYDHPENYGMNFDKLKSCINNIF